MKRLFDLFFAVFGLVFLGWLLLLILILAAIDTDSSGLFFQKRIGQYSEPFQIFKFKTFHSTTHSVSSTGRFLRKSKLDELPQLFNVLIGNMSVVGPRPDVPGYYDRLQGEERKILELKPGLTSPASLKYFNEENLLSEKENPLEYNDTIIFPDKVKMNLAYYNQHSFWGDIWVIFNTVFRKQQD